jgi:hypothetical protein
MTPDQALKHFEGAWCYSDAATKRVAKLMLLLRQDIRNGALSTWDEVLSEMQAGLESIGARNGALDTIVKEMLFKGISDALENAGIEFDQMDIYGW